MSRYRCRRILHLVGRVAVALNRLEEHSLLLVVAPEMKDTDEKAKAGMSRFVVTILGIALLIAAVYFIFWTPGETNVAPTSNAINRSE